MQLKLVISRHQNHRLGLFPRVFLMSTVEELKNEKCWTMDFDSSNVFNVHPQLYSSRFLLQSCRLWVSEFPEVSVRDAVEPVSLNRAN